MVAKYDIPLPNGESVVVAFEEASRVNAFQTVVSAIDEYGTTVGGTFVIVVEMTLASGQTTTRNVTVNETRLEKFLRTYSILIVHVKH